ncbi:sister chromatid cohesion protein Dcc1 [Fennellomyces sp. T-0311]|nr:sister chromatid cohesion protein Dcc1 [Fennellomyces sp. T-0311]
MPELYYSNAFHKGTYRLIELSDEKIAKAIESSGELVIKGLPEDEAVLCTEDQTFSLREVDTSNSLLLARTESPNDQNLHVLDDLSYTIEAIPCLARLGRINELLQPTQYAGRAAEANLENKVQYTYEDLLSIVQASEVELQRGLAERNTFILNAAGSLIQWELLGKYRMLERNYMNGLLDALLTNVDIAGLDLHALPIEAAKDCIRQNQLDGQDIPEEVVEVCLNAFGDEVDGMTLRLSQERVCRFIGEWILTSEPGKEWTEEDFMDIWRKVTRGTFSPDMDMLKGLYVMTERKTIHRMQNYISYFPLAELPDNPVHRFASLFSKKPLWTLEEITPYIEDIAPDSKARDKLLLKYTRRQTNKDQTVYSSRIK